MADQKGSVGEEQVPVSEKTGGGQFFNEIKTLHRSGKTSLWKFALSILKNRKIGC
jgi:hypothetical protein